MVPLGTAHVHLQVRMMIGLVWFGLVWFGLVCFSLVELVWFGLVFGELDWLLHRAEHFQTVESSLHLQVRIRIGLVCFWVG